MKEIWKEITDFENYEVSNFGNIRSLIDSHNKIREFPLLRKQQKQKTGYLYIGLSKNNKIYTKLVHRLVAKAFIENSNNKPDINHINGIKTDNRVQNLEWATRTENQIHAYKIGLQKIQYGEKTSQAKLNGEQVIQIKKLRKETSLTLKQIAKKLNIQNYRNLENILYGKSWNHLND